MYMKITRLNTKFSLQHTPILPNGGKLHPIISIKNDNILTYTTFLWDDCDDT